MFPEVLDEVRDMGVSIHGSILVRPSVRPLTASDVAKAASLTPATLRPAGADLARVSGLAHEENSVTGAAMGVVRTIGYVDRLYNAGRGALGHQTAAKQMRLLRCVTIGFGLYEGVRSLTTHISPQSVKAVLKGANRGQDVSAEDTSLLASKMNRRVHVKGCLAIGSSLVMALGMASHHLPLSIGGVVLRMAGLTYGLVSSYQTSSDAERIIEKSTSPLPV
jgi:hypothetical protein